MAKKLSEIASGDPSVRRKKQHASKQNARPRYLRLNKSHCCIGRAITRNVCRTSNIQTAQNKSAERELYRGHTGRGKSMSESSNKVPEVTLTFWIIKIAATTLGETGGDTVTMTLNWGYLAGTALFLATLAVLVGLQIATKRFRPFLYWATIIASTTFGTTMADFADRSLGIGYTGGSSLLLFCLLVTLGLWYWSMGSISVDTINTPKTETFYWTAVTFSQTLGTALGDWMADSTGLGYEGGALVFGAALVIVAAAHYWTNVSRVALFWTAFILTRPLGATVGDLLDKPVRDGGLALSRPLASAVLAIFILVCLLVLPQRAGSHSAQVEAVGK
jgi:uncharacterized membrane-anchored protein